MPINSAGRFDVSKSTVLTDNWTQMHGKNAGNNIKLHISILSRGSGEVLMDDVSGTSWNLRSAKQLHIFHFKTSGI